ncbi:MAG: radical SAM protein [Nitrososphaera sp.]
MSQLWYKGAPKLEAKKSKSIIHSFVVREHSGLTINPYQGCQHRCAYCYATYEWSPEFYDKIYAKSNAPEILEIELAKWKPSTIQPVMISSATDCYQPAELRYGLTRRCIEVLQKYRVPYYVFTKSAIIERDLELHKQYRSNCCVVWSITSCNEKVRRIVEPGTPPAGKIFAAIKKFADAGVSCAVNVDPIMPLISDTVEELDLIIANCKSAGVNHVFGAVLRLRSDIWERMSTVFGLLGISDAERIYKEIYNFEVPGSSYLIAKMGYEKKVLDLLEMKVKESGMLCRFPNHMVPSKIEKPRLGQRSITGYFA